MSAGEVIVAVLIAVIAMIVAGVGVVYVLARFEEIRHAEDWRRR